MSDSRRALALSPAQREQLEQWLAAHGTPQQVALRCRIVLAATQGGPDLSIAAAIGVNRHTVTLWRKRFAEQGLQCLWQGGPGGGREPVCGSQRSKGGEGGRGGGRKAGLWNRADQGGGRRDLADQA